MYLGVNAEVVLLRCVQCVVFEYLDEGEGGQRLPRLIPAAFVDAHGRRRMAEGATVPEESDEYPPKPNCTSCHLCSLPAPSMYAEELS